QYPTCSDIYTLSLHDALPILQDHLNILSDVGAIDLALGRDYQVGDSFDLVLIEHVHPAGFRHELDQGVGNFFHHDDFFFAGTEEDRKSTRLNSSHVAISYAVF